VLDDAVPEFLAQLRQERREGYGGVACRCIKTRTAIYTGPLPDPRRPDGFDIVCGRWIRAVPAYVGMRERKKRPPARL